jgi:hypothetical protein
MRVCSAIFWSRKLVKFPAHRASNDWVWGEELKSVLESVPLFLVCVTNSADVVAVVAAIATAASDFLAAFRGVLDAGVTILAFEHSLWIGGGVKGFGGRGDRRSGVMVVDNFC